MTGKIFARAEDVVARRIGGEVVLVPIRRRVGDMECVFTLNEVGARIWDLCDGSRGGEAITAAITTEYAVTPEEAACDVTTFLNDLQEAGMIEETRHDGLSDDR